MNEKALKVIHHVVAAALADDSETAVVEFDKAGELIDELVQEHQDRPEGEEEEKEVEKVQPEEDEPEEEDSGVRAKVGEKVGTVKESVPMPPSPLALAGLGVVAALAALGALKALSGHGEE
jgi:archaellum component FlaD/FlaE